MRGSSQRTIIIQMAIDTKINAGTTGGSSALTASFGVLQTRSRMEIAAVPSNTKKSSAESAAELNSAALPRQCHIQDPSHCGRADSSKPIGQYFRRHGNSKVIRCVRC